jgi:hypothetical protein
MSWEAFADAVESPSLRVLVAHWREVRGDRLMPAWNDVSPAAIKAQLPIIWAWKFDPVADEFTGRLAGERIEALFGKSIRGIKMTDVIFGRGQELTFARHKRVVASPLFFRGHGLVYRHMDRFDIGERVILPLADDGANGDGIIGATEFHSNFGAPPDALLRSGETEEWFALD